MFLHLASNVSIPDVPNFCDLFQGTANQESLTASAQQSHTSIWRCLIAGSNHHICQISAAKKKCPMVLHCQTETARLGELEDNPNQQLGAMIPSSYRSYLLPFAPWPDTAPWPSKGKAFWTALSSCAVIGQSFGRRM